MFKTAYITTETMKNGKPTGLKHNYCVTPEQMAGEDWTDEKLLSFKEAGTFKFSEIISDNAAGLLFMAVMGR